MEKPLFLGFDIGGTKTAWCVMDMEGEMGEQGSFPTPTEPEAFLKSVEKIAAEHPAAGIGIGMAGVFSSDRTVVLASPHLPDLKNLPLVSRLEEASGLPVTLDNDARCALIGEVWKGSASEYSSVVLLTLGTGVGGAVMQKGKVRPHPQDISREIGRIVVDPTDVFPALSGPGTVEAFLGGRNLETRLHVSLKELSTEGHAGKSEAVEAWKDISYYFIQCMKSIHAEYGCKAIIIGGIGSKDLDLYLQDTPPCPVLPARLGEKAGLYGAVRLAADHYLEATEGEWA